MMSATRISRLYLSSPFGFTRQSRACLRSDIVRRAGCLAVAVLACVAAAPSAAGPVLGLELKSENALRHGYGFDFVKVGNYIYATGWETEHKLKVIPVDANGTFGTPVNVHRAPNYRSDNICLDSNRNELIVSCNYDLLTYSLTTPSSPSRRENAIFQPAKHSSSHHPFHGLAVRGDRLYVTYCFDAVDAGTNISAPRALRIYDLNTNTGMPPINVSCASPDPSTILPLTLTDHNRRLSFLTSIQHSPKGILFEELGGSRCYAGFGAGVLIADISTSGSETYLGRFEPPSVNPGVDETPKYFVESIAVKDKCLLVATSNRVNGTSVPDDSPNGVEVWNCNDPAIPAFLTRLKLTISGVTAVPHAIARSGNVLVVASTTKNTWYTDANSNVLDMGTHGTISALPKVICDNQYAFRSHVQTINLASVDCTTNSTMSVLATYTLPQKSTRAMRSGYTPFRSVVIDGAKVYVGDCTFGLYSFDLNTSSGALTKLDEEPIVHNEVQAVTVKSKRVLITGIGQQVPADVTSPTAVTLEPENTHPFPGVAGVLPSRDEADQRMYTSPIESGVHGAPSILVWDVSNMSAPRVLKLVDVPATWELYRVHSHGDFVYAIACSSCNNTLKLFVYKKTSAPTYLEEQSTAHRILWSGGHFIAHESVIRSEVQENRVVYALNAGNINANVRGDPVWLGVVDVRSPLAPVVLGAGWIRPAQGQSEMLPYINWRQGTRFTQGNYAYLHGGTVFESNTLKCFMYIVDISSPRRPRIVNELNLDPVASASGYPWRYYNHYSDVSVIPDQPGYFLAQLYSTGLRLFDARDPLNVSQPWEQATDSTTYDQDTSSNTCGALLAADPKYGGWHSGAVAGQYVYVARLDDLEVYRIKYDCNSNGVDDGTELTPDCNTNLTPDLCDKLTLDRNADGAIDSCSPTDCDNNSVSDYLQTDCNTNGKPDQTTCESLTDCDTNGTPDICDILRGVGTDANTNAALDLCDGWTIVTSLASGTNSFTGDIVLTGVIELSETTTVSGTGHICVGRHARIVCNTTDAEGDCTTHGAAGAAGYDLTIQTTANNKNVHVSGLIDLSGRNGGAGVSRDYYVPGGTGGAGGAGGDLTVKVQQGSAFFEATSIVRLMGGHGGAGGHSSNLATDKFGGNGGNGGAGGVLAVLRGSDGTSLTANAALFHGIVDCSGGDGAYGGDGSIGAASYDGGDGGTGGAGGAAGHIYAGWDGAANLRFGQLRMATGSRLLANGGAGGHGGLGGSIGSPGRAPGIGGGGAAGGVAGSVVFKFTAGAGKSNELKGSISMIGGWGGRGGVGGSVTDCSTSFAGGQAGAGAAGGDCDTNSVLEFGSGSTMTIDTAFVIEQRGGYGGNGASGGKWGSTGGCGATTWCSGKGGAGGNGGTVNATLTETNVTLASSNKVRLGGNGGNGGNGGTAGKSSDSLGTRQGCGGAAGSAGTPSTDDGETATAGTAGTPTSGCASGACS